MATAPKWIVSWRDDEGYGHEREVMSAAEAADVAAFERGLGKLSVVVTLPGGRVPPLGGDPPKKIKRKAKKRKD